MLVVCRFKLALSWNFKFSYKLVNVVKEKRLKYTWIASYKQTKHYVFTLIG